MIQLRERTTRSYRSYLYALIVLILLILLIARPTIPFSLTSALYGVGEPLWGTQTHIGGWFASLSVLWSEKRALQERVEELETELSRIELKALSQELIEEENARLKTMLNRALHEEPILAFVRARPPHTPYDTLILDAGEEEGVAPGFLVVSRDGAVLGTIASVFPHTAKAHLFSSPGRETLVVLGAARVETTAIGRGAGNFEALIPRGIEVSIGDAVVMPAGVPRTFAVVEEVIVRPTDSLQRVLFKNPVNLFELGEVSIVPSVTIVPPEVYTAPATSTATSTTEEAASSDIE